MKEQEKKEEVKKEQTPPPNKKVIVVPRCEICGEYFTRCRCSHNELKK